MPMTDNTKTNEEPAAPKAPEAKPAGDDKAEAQGRYHLYCDKCGHTWWSDNWPTYCVRWGCTGHAHQL